MYQPTIFEDFPNTIFSQGLADGVTPCALPGGPTTSQSGQEVALVSPLALRAKEMELKIHAICGPSGFRSLHSAALQLSLENKLCQRFDTAGSIWFSMIWRPLITPARRRIYQLAALARSINGRGSGSWPTPCANEDAAGSLRGDMQWMLTHEAKYREREKANSGQQLNPNLARWLMRYPIGWQACAAMVTRSCRK